MIRKIWHALVVFYVRAFISLGLYRLKSNLYRALFERDFKDIKLQLFYDFHTLGKFIKPDAWRGDNLLSLFDAVGYPGKAQKVFEGKLHPAANFDCDEFAIWLTCTIQRCMVADTLPVQGVGFMTVIYAKDGLKISGHNVCLFGRIVEGDLKYFVMDYDLPRGPYATPQEAAGAVAEVYGAEPLCFGVSDYQLRPLMTGDLR